MTAIGPEQRHTRQHPCDVCRGHASLPRGIGQRCWGCVSSDGQWILCSREQFGAGVEQTNDGLYKHKRSGPCLCGHSHNAEITGIRDRESQTRPREIVAVYGYCDAEGRRIAEKIRYEPKSFAWRRPGGSMGLGGVQPGFYRLPQLVADDGDRPVYLVEGEKDADALAALGHCVVSPPHGAKPFAPNVVSEAHLHLGGREVVIIADRDDAGRLAADHWAGALREHAASVRIVECTRGKDWSEHAGAGGNLDELTSTQSSTHWDRLTLSVPQGWWTEPPPARRWLLRDDRRKGEGLLPLGKVGHLVAEGGAGKTMLLAQLAVAVATGAPWLGHFGVSAPGRVLLALGEEDSEETHRRLYRARSAAKAPIPAENSIVVLPLAGELCALLESDRQGNPIDSKFFSWLSLYAETHGPWSLIVLDPLSRFSGLDAETYNAVGTRYIQTLESFARHGPTVLSAHHTAKGQRGGGQVDAHGARGVTSIVDGARWVATLSRQQVEHDDEETAERLGEIVTLAFPKSNYSRHADPLELRYSQEHGGALLPLDDVDRDLVRAARGAESPRGRQEARRSEDCARQDAAVLAALRASPRLSWRQLCVRVAATAGCGDYSARKAIERMSQELEIHEDGRQVLYTLKVT